METEVVRYGNARLTIARSGSLVGDDELGRTLARHEKGEAGTDEVAWAFVRARTLDHSPSFVWGDARLPKLVELVTAVSADPAIEARTSDELAKFLAGQRQAELAKSKPVATPPPAPAPASAPAPVAAAAQPPKAPPPAKKQRRFRFLPQRTIWRVVLGLGIVLLVAAFLGARHYLNEVPKQLADDYREKAQPATEKVTDAMDRAFAAYDSYLENSTLPRSETRNADEIDEIKRRFLPLYEDTEAALAFGERAIRDARKMIKKQRADFSGVPSAPFLDEKDEVLEAEEAQASSKAYLKEAERFLTNFEKFLKFEDEALAIRRTEVKSLGGTELSADASLEEVKASLEQDLAEAKNTRDRYLEIKPHPDQEKLYDVYTELSTVGVDYLEDLIEGYNNLSLPQIRAADDEYLAAFKPLDHQASYLVGVFAVESSLQEQSRKLGRIGDELEKQVAGLGTGDGELTRPDRFRKPVPPLPRKPDQGQNPGDQGQSQS